MTSVAKATTYLPRVHFQHLPLSRLCLSLSKRQTLPHFRPFFPCLSFLPLFASNKPLPRGAALAWCGLSGPFQRISDSISRRAGGTGRSWDTDSGGCNRYQVMPQGKKSCSFSTAPSQTGIPEAKNCFLRAVCRGPGLLPLERP